MASLHPSQWPSDLTFCLSHSTTQPLTASLGLQGGRRSSAGHVWFARRTAWYPLTDAWDEGGLCMERLIPIQVRREAVPGGAELGEALQEGSSAGSRALSASPARSHLEIRGEREESRLRMRVKCWAPGSASGITRKGQEKLCVHSKGCTATSRSAQ